MSRVPHSSRGRVQAPAIAADRHETIPAVSDTTPLPSDQTSAPVERVVAGVVADRAVAGLETSPLPRPERAPGGDVAETSGKPPLVHVDGTIPLPSDQLTPLVSPIGTTDVSATTESASRGAAHDERAFDAEVTRGVARYRAEDDQLDRGPERVAFVGSPMGGRRAFDLLREALEDAGYGVVILTADTVNALRDVLNLPPLYDTSSNVRLDDVGDEVAGDEERRRFRVVADVLHDRKRIPPGGVVNVTFAEFERLRAGTSIAAYANWSDGD